MNWDAIAAVGQVLGVIAVVVTLAYLVIQVRDGTAINLRNMAFQRQQSINGDFLGTPYLASIQAKIWNVDGASPATKALKERYQLTDEEAVRWIRHHFILWGGVMADWRYAGHGVVGHLVRNQLQNADVQIVWDESVSKVLPTDFVAYVESIRAGTLNAS